MSPFDFKQFTVDDDRTSMKVGTDAVILGASVVIPTNTMKILDIGSGSGIVALMLAQRSEVEVHAVELLESAYLDAKQNFDASGWRHLLHCAHADITLWKTELKFDVIVSNPPYFCEDTLSSDSERAQARSAKGLSYKALINSCKRLMVESGEISIILPYSNRKQMIFEAGKIDLFLHKELLVRDQPKAAFKRSVLTFTDKAPKAIQESVLDIRDEKNTYSKQFMRLTKDFYLHF